MIAYKSRIGRVAAIATLSFLLSSCASLTEGYADSWGGFRARSEMCKNVRGFVRSPLPEDGLRRVWFLPFGSYDDGSVDFYAPMASDPSDEHSSAFYSNRVGQLTHYLFMPEFASAVSNCLSSFRGFSHGKFDLGEDHFRASIRDRKTDRRIEVAADGNTATFLIASANWSGDIEVSLKRQSAVDCEDES
ncbi:MAG: hypothetical protein AAFN50_13910 [Pseudomonadota bacterium]